MAGSRFGNTLYAEYQTGDQQKADVGFDKVSTGRLVGST
jgi:hypothetical protein